MTEQSNYILNEAGDYAFRRSLADFARVIYYHNKNKGFWEEGKAANRLEKHMLMVTEIAEASEALRHNNPPSEKIPDFTSEEEELADLVIRVLDYCGAFNLRLAEAIIAKLHYNQTRPYKHGKTC